MEEKNMKEHDQIDCMLEQQGSRKEKNNQMFDVGSANAKPAAEEPQESNHATITIRVKDQAGEERFFKLNKKTTRMEKVFTTYARLKGVPVRTLRFLFDGERINPDHTPKMLDLEELDQIDCILDQQGCRKYWEEDCPICFDLPNIKAAIPCDHSFCNDCILKWDEINNSCPLCKRPFQKIMKYKKEANGQIITLTSDLTAEQRRNRRRIVRNHMQLLDHSTRCGNDDCISLNCRKMKKLLEHLEECNVQPQDGCSMCQKMSALLTFHSRLCRSQNCRVPRCQQLKESYQAQQSSDGTQAAPSAEASGGSSTNRVDS